MLTAYFNMLRIKLTLTSETVEISCRSRPLCVWTPVIYRSC